tara:strand:+ start:1214 stop:2077 length:864 start_codon:yes stop_codon:yes gene_type:complete
MARIEDPQRTAAERLRIIISRERGGYTVGRRKWARILGVSERSVERYLARPGADRSVRRNIRSREAQTKINRAFRSRMRKDPLFLATMVLEPGQLFDVTKWMAPSIGNGSYNIKPEWMAGSEDRNPNSVWFKQTVKRLPRIVFTGGKKMGLAFGNIALDLDDPDGGFIASGQIHEFATSNEEASSTFGFVSDKDLAIKGRTDDLTIGINNALERKMFGFASAVTTLAIFDPETAIQAFPNYAAMENIGTAVRNRRPNVERFNDPVTGNPKSRNFWNERKRQSRRRKQ